ncbi:MAG TPA: hypothetical protein VGH60_04400 [Solirubrobacteraceae bacterium]
MSVRARRATGSGARGACAATTGRERHHRYRHDGHEDEAQAGERSATPADGLPTTRLATRPATLAFQIPLVHLAAHAHYSRTRAGNQT